MATSTSGGMNRTDVYAVNVPGTGLIQVTALSILPLVSTAISDTDDAFLKSNQNFSTGITPVRLNKGMELTFDQDKFGGALLTACDVFVQGDTATVEYYENAVAAPALTASGTTVNNGVAITYIGLDPDDTTKMMCIATHGNFKEGSGAFVNKKGERRKPKIDFVSKATTADLIIPSAAFDSALVTGASKTITSGLEFIRFNLTAT